jgi:tRNA(His) 5'-end guanylyltransferase
MMFSQFGINYNALPLRFRKGTVLVREQVNASSTPSTIRLSVNTSYDSALKWRDRCEWNIP